MLKELSLIRVYLVLVLIIVAFFVLRKFLKAPPEVVSDLIKKVGVAMFLVLIVFFAATGRLNWLFALAGVFVAFVIRMLPFIMRYVPQLHGLWMAFKKNKNQSSNTNKPSNYKGAMTKKEAAEVLGVSLTASETEIIMAHKKLMQKMHPDRGGSDYLAAKINQAKAVLLNNK